MSALFRATGLTTDSDGDYMFANLSAGTYNVCASTSNGWYFQTTPIPNGLVTLLDGGDAGNVLFGEHVSYRTPH